MNELLKVDFKNAERPTVSGRGLHAALGVQTRYSDWFGRMCEYGFEDGRDFNLLKFEQVQLEGTRTVKREITDHQLTIDMAKEIAMLQRTEKGKEVREYFIRVEKEFNSPETMIARALIMASRQLEARDRLIEEMKPKAAFYDLVADAKNAISFAEAAKMLGIPGLGQNNLFKLLREKKILLHTNIPYQEYMDRGYFRVIDQSYTKPDGTVLVSPKTLITQRGLDYIGKMVTTELAVA